MAEEVCRLLLIVSQEEGALVARQQPPAQQQAAPDGGAGSGVPAAVPAAGLSSGPQTPAAPTGHAAPALTQPGQPMPLPTASVTLQNGTGRPGGPPHPVPAQQTASPAGQPPMPSAAGPVVSPVAAAPSLPAMASPPPGVPGNGAYARAVHAASQQARCHNSLEDMLRGTPRTQSLNRQTRCSGSILLIYCRYLLLQVLTPSIKV